MSQHTRAELVDMFGSMLDEDGTELFFSALHYALQAKCNSAHRDVEASASARSVANEWERVRQLIAAVIWGE